MLILICLDCGLVTYQGKVGRFIQSFLTIHQACIEKGTVLSIEGKFIPVPERKGREHHVHHLQ